MGTISRSRTTFPDDFGRVYRPMIISCRRLLMSHSCQTPSDPATSRDDPGNNPTRWCLRPQVIPSEDGGGGLLPEARLSTRLLPRNGCRPIDIHPSRRVAGRMPLGLSQETGSRRSALNPSPETVRKRVR